jgi:hypothetical protein
MVLEAYEKIEREDGVTYCPHCADYYLTEKGAEHLKELITNSLVESVYEPKKIKIQEKPLLAGGIKDPLLIKNPFAALHILGIFSENRDKEELLSASVEIELENGEKYKIKLPR